MIPFTCNIRSPSLRPAKLASESGWILLTKCTCDVISACGINELKSSPIASGIVIKRVSPCSTDNFEFGRGGEESCLPALKTEIYIIYCKFLNIVNQ